MFYYDFIVVHHLLLPILDNIPPKKAKGRLNRKDNAISPAALKTLFNAYFLLTFHTSIPLLAVFSYALLLFLGPRLSLFCIPQ